MVLTTLPKQLADVVEELRSADRVEALTDFEVRRRLGRQATILLRRLYFPRWRPGRALDTNPRLRAFTRLVVRDEFERRLVEAVAPEDIEVAVTVADETHPTSVHDLIHVG